MLISRRRFGMEGTYLASCAGVILAQDWRIAASSLGTELVPLPCRSCLMCDLAERW
ncbi:hypothetical protein E2C01_060534 [Portunus trituberculatus]|uniref:Uncharacterized protein n=1 Tax=Portunus trituberculatus TaxID=210409 RepID=A0A5B7HAR5_PORTR|nr:hypothetical protein [Portunus trituberculatus]